MEAPFGMNSVLDPGGWGHPAPRVFANGARDLTAWHQPQARILRFA